MDEHFSFPEDRRGMNEFGFSRPEGRRPTPLANVRVFLSKANLRPTRQRLTLATLLFGNERRHVSADVLHAEALQQGTMLSLSTVYNTLDQFVEAGLIRRLAVPGPRSYFDTDTGDHQHFYIEGEERIIDIPAGTVKVGEILRPPEGYRVVNIDVIVRLRKVSATDWLAAHAAAEPPPNDRPLEKFQGVRP